jgi:hypothetical protein
MVSYVLTRDLTTRTLAFVYVCAFCSALYRDQWATLANPVDGLTPATLSPLPNPVHQLLRFGVQQMHLVSWVGLCCAVATLVFPRVLYLLLVVCWLMQLALINTSALWIKSFGWEWQVLETTIPVVLMSITTQPSLVALLCVRWLAFRVMLGAGMSKVGARSSVCWGLSQLSCTTTHYLTQPMPNPLSIYMHALPHWFHQFEVLCNHLVELVLPWFILIGWRPLRVIGATLSILYMFALLCTGNYAYIQVITIVPLIG